MDMVRIERCDTSLRADFMCATPTAEITDALQMPCRQEDLIDVEQALGRDASSVFPTESAKPGMLGLDKEATKEALGAVKFVTESEVVSSWRRPNLAATCCLSHQSRMCPVSHFALQC